MNSSVAPPADAPSLFETVLETGDKISSVLGALIGLIALVIAIKAYRLERAEIRRPATDAVAVRRFRFAVIAAIIGVCCGATGAFAPLPLWARWSAAGASAAAIGACVLLLHLRREAIEEQARRLPDRVIEFLTAQRDRPLEHRYSFYGGHVPALREIFVQQRGQTRPSPLDQAEEVVIPLRSILGRHDHVLLVGDAGAGKSTAATLLATEASAWLLEHEADEESPHGPGVPVGISAPDLVELSMADAVRQAVQHLPGTAATGQPGETELTARRWLVFVDGLDEIVSHQDRSRVLSRLTDVIDRERDRYRLVILTRPLPYTELVSLRRRGLGDYELLPFNAEELAEFSRNGSSRPANRAMSSTRWSPQRDFSGRCRRRS